MSAEVETQADLSPESLKSIFKPLLEEGIAQAEARADERAKKFNFSGSADDAAKAEKAAKRLESVKFVKALVNRDEASLKEISEIRAKGMNETTGTAGGYLVPVEFEREVVRFMPQYNELRSIFNVKSMSANQMKLNDLTTDVTAYIVGEASAITASQPTFGEPVLTAKKYAGITVLSSEFEEDAEVNVDSLLAERFAMAIGIKEQTEFLSGTTAGSKGVFEAAGTSDIFLVTGNAFSSLSWDDLRFQVAALQALDMNQARNGVFLMHPSVYNTLALKKSAGTGDYFTTTAVQGGDIYTAWGQRVVLCNQAPSVTATGGTKFVGFADWKNHAYIGDRRGLTVTLLNEGTIGSVNLAETDQKAVRVTKRTAFVTANNSGITILKTN